uniref:Tr-type G domain-containing protein n=1 Tax=Echinostoma caproni TaxID=27848 RepID=A0A183B5Z3_9TREM
LAGHSKYQRTTLAGLSRSQPVGVLLVVSATTGLTSVGLEHAELAHGLGLPLAVVISKIDQLVGETDRLNIVNTIRRELIRKLNVTTSSPSGKENPERDAVSITKGRKCSVG